MIPPGKEYAYQFRPETPMVAYYHCYSADKEFPINQHILQGLYGMIIVEDPKAPAVREEVLFMAETTRVRRGTVGRAFQVLSSGSAGPSRSSR